MTDIERLTVSRTVDVDAARLFDVLVDPARHVEFDTASMVRGVAEGGRVHAIGDRFVMDMHNERLGEYRTMNVVVAFEEGRVLGWAPSLHPLDGYSDTNDFLATGHSYTWTLEPAGGGRTTVTQTYDWSGVTDPLFRERFPRLSHEQLGASIERVADVAARD